jgi:aryl-alcohol dehydrogenase
LARELGATDVIDGSSTDLDSALATLGGIDLSLDTTGVPAVIEAAVRNLKVRGQLVLVGASQQKVMSTDIMHLISGRAIRGAVEGEADPARFIPFLVEQFLAGGFPLDRISSFYPFDQINAAIADGVGGKAIKPIVVF